jgi:hypothetical protein
MERRIKEINRFTVGWTAYFRFVRSRTLTNGSDADCGKCDGRNGSAPAREGATCEHSVSPQRTPANGRARAKGYWRVAGSWPLQTALPNAYWHKTMGLKGFTVPYRRFRDAKRTAGCGPARPVVWGAPG